MSDEHGGIPAGGGDAVGSNISTGGAFQLSTGGAGTGASRGHASGGNGADQGTGGGPAVTSSGGAFAVDGAGGNESVAQLTIEEGQTGFCDLDGSIESTNGGFSGTGYANSDNVAGAAIRWSVASEAIGSFLLRIAYANEGEARAATLTVGGKKVSADLWFPSTLAWTTWSVVTIDVPLAFGTNDIELIANGDHGLANIDYLSISGKGLTARKCNSDVVDLPDITVYVAGDSTVSTYADTASDADQAGWGQMLHEIFDERVSVENRARGGRTALWFHLEGETAWVLERIQPEDYFFVQFGTNDSHTTATFTVGGTTYPRFAEAGGAFKQHLIDYYIEPTRNMGATPVLVTPPPRNSAYCGTGNSLGGYAQAMRELGESEGVLVLDNNQRTFDYLAAQCPAPTPERFFFVRGDSSVDGTHFQETGARFMAQFIGEEMADEQAGPYQYLAFD